MRSKKTFYYGHTYTGHQLGCAAALASLALFGEENVLEMLQSKITLLSKLLEPVAKQPHVVDVRQCGFIAGIEIAEAFKGKPYDASLQMGARVCVEARQKHGLLTRPIRDTIVLLPPYCISDGQLSAATMTPSPAPSPQFARCVQILRRTRRRSHRGTEAFAAIQQSAARGFPR